MTTSTPRFLSRLPSVSIWYVLPTPGQRAQVDFELALFLLMNEGEKLLRFAARGLAEVGRGVDVHRGMVRWFIAPVCADGNLVFRGRRELAIQVEI